LRIRKYHEAEKKIRDELRRCRDRSVRVKAELILLGLRLGNVSEACGRRGFSRKFYYKWWGRLRRAKFELWGLAEESRRPRKSPSRIDGVLEKRIRFFHKKGNGARMIAAYLAREGIRVSSTTICHVLNRRRKVVKKRRDKLKAHRRRYELVVPGQRVQVDVKYVPEFVAGRRVYNYVAVDECTRLRFARSYYELNGESTADFLERMREAFCFPVACVQTDNGFEFTYRLIPTTKGEMPDHPMGVWCKANGVRQRCIPPGEKELNGKVERSHRIDEQYFYWRAPTDSLEHFNRALARWIREYNEDRPHGGLSYSTPSEKLEERIRALQARGAAGEILEPVRLRFIQAMTRRQMSKEDREIDKLLSEAKKLAA
jgi:transposase InsO family protein